jgi:hypothetical protein
MVGTRSHKGTFNSVTGVTSAIEKLWRNTSLGERYLLYRHSAADPQESATKALDEANEKKHMREELSRAACGVLAGVDQDCVPTCSSTIKQRIVKLAALLAKARTHVQRDRDHKVEEVAEPEGPSRIALQLFKLGQGLALIKRRAEITEADLPILGRVALDSMPLARRRLLAVLARFGPGKRILTVSFEHLGWSKSAVRERLEDLCLLGICDKREEPKRQGETQAKVSYMLTAEFRSLLEGVDFGDAPRAAPAPSSPKELSAAAADSDEFDEMVQAHANDPTWYPDESWEQDEP